MCDTNGADFTENEWRVSDSKSIKVNIDKSIWFVESWYLVWSFTSVWFVAFFFQAHFNKDGVFEEWQ